MEEAQALHEPSRHNAETSICMFRRKMTYQEALEALEKAGGMVKPCPPAVEL